MVCDNAENWVFFVMVGVVVIWLGRRFKRGAWLLGVEVCEWIRMLESRCYR